MLKINLLLEKKRPEGKFLWIIPPFILLILLCLLLYSLQGKRISFLEEENRVLFSQIERLKTIGDSVANLKSKDKEFKEKIAVFNTIDRERIPSQLLQKIAELRPQGVQIKEISLNPDFAEVKGKAWTYRHAARFVQRLTESNSFTRVTLNQSKPLKSGEGIEFIIRAER